MKRREVGGANLNVCACDSSDYNLAFCVHDDHNLVSSSKTNSREKKKIQTLLRKNPNGALNRTSNAFPVKKKWFTCEGHSESERGTSRISGLKNPKFQNDIFRIS